MKADSFGLQRSVKRLHRLPGVEMSLLGKMGPFAETPRECGLKPVIAFSSSH